RFFAVRAVKNVILFDFFPREFTALFAKFIAEARKLFFLFEESRAGGEPLCVGYNFLAWCCACCCHLASPDLICRGGAESLAPTRAESYAASAFPPCLSS